jgi:hypothetical protein
VHLWSGESSRRRIVASSHRRLCRSHPSERGTRRYTAFIQNFIGVYEYTAPPYTRESAAWSESPANVARYIADGRKMKDVAGIGRHRD